MDRPCPDCGSEDWAGIRCHGDGHPELVCIDGPRDCAGPVEWRTTPDRTDGKHFTRCEHHFDLRLADSPRISELTSPARAPWFDEADAGERWDEDE